MNTQKTTLPIEYWNSGKTRLIQEEDENGRIVGRKVTDTYYKLKYILNGTGFGSVAVIKMERVNGLPVVK